MGQVNLPSNLLDRIRRLERELAEVRKRVGLGNSAISSGTLILKGGGGVNVLHPNGQVLGRVGFVGQINDEFVWGFQLQRADGSEIFKVVATEGGHKIMEMSDDDENVVLSVGAGRGLGRPHLQLPLFPAFNSEWASSIPSTQSSTFVDMWWGRVQLQHSRLGLFALVQPVDGLSTGEARFTLNGAVVGPTVEAVGSGAFIFEPVDVPGWDDENGYPTMVDIRLQARRTAGAGKIAAIPYGIYGFPSN